MQPFSFSVSLALWLFFITEALFCLAPLAAPDPVALPRSCICRVAIGYLVGLAQFAGGLAMLTGILIRVGAVCIIVVMLGAIYLVHLPHGFDVTKGGVEYALTQLLIAIALLLTGAGKYSLSAWLPSPLRKL